MKKLKYNTEKCLACRSCEIVCAVGKSDSKTLDSAIKEQGVFPRVKVFSGQGKNLPISCRQCQDAKCITACISSALSRDKKTGRVVYDRSKCVGCWMCVMVCPYGAIRPDYKTKKVIRCDLCADTDSPRCLESCPVKAIEWVENI